MSVCRELVLVKVAAGAEDRTRLKTIADIFRANVVDISLRAMMLEMTGATNKTDAFIKQLELDGFEINELVRTGISGLTRGFASVDD